MFFFIALRILGSSLTNTYRCSNFCQGARKRARNTKDFMLQQRRARRTTPESDGAEDRQKQTGGQPRPTDPNTAHEHSAHCALNPYVLFSNDGGGSPQTPVKTGIQKDARDDRRPNPTGRQTGRSRLENKDDHPSNNRPRTQRPLRICRNSNMRRSTWCLPRLLP